MKKYLIITLLSCLQFFKSIGQITPASVSNGIITLYGKGQLGGTNDAAQWYRYKKNLAGNFFISAYFRSITNSNTSFTGLSFRNETNAPKTDGGISAVGIFVENDTLKAKVRLADNGQYLTMAILPNIKLPMYLKIEKQGNTVNFYYSKSAENVDPIYTLMSSIDNVFQNWNAITQNFGTGNSTGNVSTAIVSKRLYGPIKVIIPSCNNGGSFDIISVTNTSGSLYDVNYNAANFSSANIDIKNSSGFSVKNFDGNYTTRPFNIDVGTQANGTYTLTITGKSCIGTANKTFTIGTIGTNGTGGTTTQTSTFKNIINQVPYETTLGKYDPDAFPTISVINSLDPKLNRNMPNWIIGWKVEGKNFANSTKNKKTQNIGIPFMYDIKPDNGGYGVHCVDYINEQDPNTGKMWANDVDTFCSDPQYNANFNNSAHSYENFASTIPFESKAGGNFGTNYDDLARWTNATLESGLHYDDGQEGGSAWFGMRDWINNKSNVGLSDADIEIGIENGQDGSNKHLAFLLGFGARVQGYAFSQYSAAVDTREIDPSKYPNSSSDPNSGYPQNYQLADGTDGDPASGNREIRHNSIPSSNDWNGNNKISIPIRFSGQKGILDVPNVLPCTEISSYVTATYHNGEEIYYDKDDPSLHRTTNKFGLHANAHHIIAKVIFAGETNKWFINNKLDGRRMILQSKISCDKGNLGTIPKESGNPNYANKESFKFTHFDREYGFDIGAFTAFTGCEWNIWDRNSADNVLDGYHGAFGLISLLYQRKTFGSSSVSFIDLKPRANFLFWDSEISYDGGKTYVKDEANNYIMDMTKILQRQFITPDGYWGGILARPENTENTTCKMRVSYNGQFYYYTVTADMWETVDYNNRNTALSALRNDKKDYHYFLVKLGNGTINNGGMETTSSATVNPPSITSNVANPTAGQSVTLTSTSCQSSDYTIKWYDSAEGNLLSSGTNYTVIAQNGNGYYAQCVGTSTSSTPSNTITFSISNNPSNSEAVTITGPNQVANYYKSANGSPQIINNYSYSTNDVVYLSNSQIKVGFNLRYGGAISYLSQIGSTTNIVNNGHDGGRQIQPDYYQNPSNYTQNGKSQASNWSKNGYNVTLGGDYNHNTVTLLDYHAITNGYYIKFKPLLWSFDGEISEIIIEVTYTLIGNSVKCDYNYINQRTDNQIPSGFNLNGWSLPICYLNQDFNQFYTYIGDSPFTNSPMTQNVASDVSSTGASSKELWGALVNPATGIGVAIYNKIPSRADTYFQYGRQNTHAENQNTEFNDGFALIQVIDGNNTPDSHNEWSRADTAYLIVGAITDIRSKVYQISGH